MTHPDENSYLNDLAGLDERGYVWEAPTPPTAELPPPLITPPPPPDGTAEPQGQSAIDAE